MHVTHDTILDLPYNFKDKLWLKLVYFYYITTKKKENLYDSQSETLIYIRGRGVTLLKWLEFKKIVLSFLGFKWRWCTVNGNILCRLYACLCISMWVFYCSYKQSRFEKYHPCLHSELWLIDYLKINRLDVGLVRCALCHERYTHR